MSTNTPNEVGNLIATLQGIEQALADPTSTGPVSAQTIAELQTGITNLQKLADAESITFEKAQSNTVQGKFISRAAAKPLRKEFKDWADDLFRAGPIKKIPPLYVSVHLVQHLLDRTQKETDFIELTIGKSGNTLSVMLAAVDKDGNRLDDPTKPATGGDDVLNHMAPCPQPPCPTDLDK